MADDMAGAGITAKERLERIELVLERLDHKLDIKFADLEKRIWTLELSAVPVVMTVPDLEKKVDSLRMRMYYFTGALFMLGFGVNIAQSLGWLK